MWKSNHTFDLSWIGFELYAWTAVECQLGIICACAPSLRAFFRRYLRGNIKMTFGSARNTHYKSTSSKEISTTRHDTRSYIDPEELERNVSGATVPRPSMQDLREPEAAWAGDGYFPTSRITTPEDYETYAVARLMTCSKHSGSSSEETTDLEHQYRQHAI